MSAPINVFRTVAVELTLGDPVVYTAPPNNTAIVLMAQVSNNRQPDLSDLSVEDPNNARVLFGLDVGTSTRFVVNNFLVAPSTAADLLSGKLIIEENQVLRAGLTSAPTGPGTETVDLILSVLEARNA